MKRYSAVSSTTSKIEKQRTILAKAFKQLTDYQQIVFTRYLPYNVKAFTAGCNDLYPLL
ncbi:hypothetical protein [Bacteroides stercorirosoris]|uniref:hypothetical protein n=1 Tax=Bacteroides stercorirosoris TaxID=871324 RepID=UPI000B12C743|nr:hypothetical protein [Bacteroides stercorirosoris]